MSTVLSYHKRPAGSVTLSQSVERREKSGTPSRGERLHRIGARHLIETIIPDCLEGWNRGGMVFRRDAKENAGICTAFPIIRRTGNGEAPAALPFPFWRDE